LTERVPRFTGRVERGKVHLDVRETYDRYVSGLEGARIHVTVVKHRNTRSLSQNAYYWGVVIPLLREHCGYDSDEMHEALKLRFLKSHEDTDLPSVRSTASLNTTEFGEYVDDCIRLAAELGVVIPSPEERE
jgi:hypothetical protein